jgi:hypothetical protein
MDCLDATRPTVNKIGNRTPAPELSPVPDHYDIFLSYSHNDLDAATSLRGQLERCGLTVFWDKASLREGELWLNRLQELVDACGSFVVLVGRDGVKRWIGAETQVALSRYFGPHDRLQQQRPQQPLGRNRGTAKMRVQHRELARKRRSERRRRSPGSAAADDPPPPAPQDRRN